MTSCVHKTQKWTIPIRHIKHHNSGKNQPTVRWIHIGMSYCSFHVDILKIHHFVCVFPNVQPNHSQFCRFVIFDSVDKKKLCMLTFCILLNTAKALVFSWNVACERGKPPEGAIASFYSTCYIKIWIPSVD